MKRQWGDIEKEDHLRKREPNNKEESGMKVEIMRIKK